MKRELTTDRVIIFIKEVLIIGLGGMILTFLLAYFFNSFLFSCVLPIIIDYHDATREYFLYLSIEETNDFYRVVYEACVLLGAMISFPLATRFSGGRRESFLKDSDGLWSARQGFAYHLKKNGPTDILIALMLTVAFFVSSYQSRATSPFSLLFRFCGRPLGTLFGVLILVACWMLNVVPMQNQWSARYYTDDI